MNTVELIESFKQGGTGNCVSIAVIKASIQVFGIDKVVHFSKNELNNFHFSMRDGFEDQLSHQEIDIARKESNFILLENTAVFEYAVLCFAAMAKRAQIETNEDAGSYIEAINSLNNGEFYYMGADWLGLRHYKRAIGLKYVWENIGVVGASSKHCFFCSEGIVDNYGSPNYINGLERLKYKFFNYYRIASTPMY